MTTKKFTDISHEKLAKLRTQLRGQGISVSDGDAGKIEVNAPRILFDFAYDGVSVLELTLTEKPFLVPEGMIWNKIRDGLA